MPKNKKSHHKQQYFPAIKYIWNVIKPHKKWYISASIISLLLVGVSIATARNTQWLVNSATSPNMSTIIYSLLLFILFTIFSIILTYMGGICSSKLGAKAGCDLKNRISHTLLHSKYKEMTELQAGNTLQTINMDTATVCNFIGNELNDLFSQFSLAIGVLIYLICVNPVLALVTFLYTPLGMFFTLNINKKMNELHPVRADFEGRALSVVEQVLSSIPVIKSFMAQKQIRDKVAFEYDCVYKTEAKICFWDAILQPACSSTAMIPQLVYFIFAGHLVMSGQLTIGGFIAMFDLLIYIVAPTVMFPFMLNGLNRSIASINRISLIEALPLTSSSDVNNDIVYADIPSIKLNNVCFSYTENTPIIKDFSFEHDGNGIIVLCGRSGTGKTTLLDLISGLYEPVSGEISVNGAMSVVTQDTYLFDDTLLENVRIANPTATDEQVLNALNLAGASSLINKIDKTNGDSDRQLLSGGERQRISLARTILSNASIWLLDEPTSAIDSETEKIIVDTITKVSTEKLILISAHRQSLIDLAQRRIDL